MYAENNIYIVDFDDSFTFNIASELYSFDANVVVTNHREFFETSNFNRFITTIGKPIAVILGPGPGAPSEYQTHFAKIQVLKKHNLVFLMGICLGHQILALLDGLTVAQSKKPLHGQQEVINFNDKNILVQRYNSLAVYSPTEPDTEIMVRRFSRGISYQFHPESVGTHHRNIFFKDLLSFLKKN